MFTGTKSTVAYASLFLALIAQTSAHAIPSPALGVKGKPARSDVQRPSTAKPCGNVNMAATLDSSTAIPVAADGSVTMSVVNFNAGADGSTSVSVQVDASGKGTKFVAGTVTKNGNKAPSKVESDQVTFKLPANTECTGGKNKDLCLVSVKTTAGFGACTVVSQGAKAAAPAKAATPANAPAKAATSAKNPAATPAKKPAAKPAAKPATKPGTQFITGPCKSDADCASGCCGFRSGLCAGAIIALERDGGCGRGNAKPNDNAAKKLGFKGGITSRSGRVAGSRAAMALRQELVEEALELRSLGEADLD
ncbi:hypothetical protein B0H10DRAFT_1304976 [Mycena sp. CBHHK59/15]|nr:hypothetical protein B0H10DRAFT_1304976 [Mycena sp. CBHHK59/15]